MTRLELIAVVGAAKRIATDACNSRIGQEGTELFAMLLLEQALQGKGEEIWNLLLAESKQTPRR